MDLIVAFKKAILAICAIARIPLDRQNEYFKDFLQMSLTNAFLDNTEKLSTEEKEVFFTGFAEAKDQNDLFTYISTSLEIGKYKNDIENNLKKTLEGLVKEMSIKATGKQKSDLLKVLQEFLLTIN